MTLSSYSRPNLLSTEDLALNLLQTYWMSMIMNTVTANNIKLSDINDSPWKKLRAVAHVPAKRLRKLPETDRIMEAFFKKIESFFYTDPEVCVQCHRDTANKVFVVKHEGVKLLFCSRQCIHNYWEEYGQWQHVARQQSERLIWTQCTSDCV